jgi:hypothetical protein
VPRTLTGVVAALAAACVVVLAVPAGALACGGGGTSATAVYIECGSSASGGSNATPSNQKPVKVSSGLAQNIQQHGGKHQSDLQRLAESPNFGGVDRKLQRVAPGSVATPSAVSALFDLGAGPLALIAILIASAVALLGSTGWRGWRRWRGGRLA